jgi:ribosomal-protein-alanine N-acetyltransferase
VPTIYSIRASIGLLGLVLRPPNLSPLGSTLDLPLDLFPFGFQELGLHRIFATCDVANPASSRVMEKNAMTREGTMRDNELSKGEWRSSYLYAILEQEHLQGASAYA